VRGQPVSVSVWVATQLKDPELVCVPARRSKRMAHGYVVLSPQPPPSLRVHKNLLTLRRDRWVPYKIGTQASDLIWVGAHALLHIHSPRVKVVVYPDKDSSAEVFTSPDPLRYVQLSTLGPLYILRPGDRIERTNTYTLYRRGDRPPEEQARRILSR